jgi:conjugal transfer pilus assembly protein TraF
MKLSKIAIASMLAVSCSTMASSVSFFNDRERGWFWWEVEPVEEEVKEEKVKPLPPGPAKPSESEESKTIVIGIEWLKSNLPKLQDQAIEDPTEDNLRNFAYAQRLMLDYGSRFSTEMSQFMKQEQLLDEERRRPTSAMRLASFQNGRYAKVGDNIKLIADNAHIWFFYRSDCPYCHKQIPLLVQLQNDLNIKVLAVSMDGKPMAGIEKFEVVVDEGLRMSRELEVIGTPSLFLVSNEKKFRYPLTSGLEPMDKIVARIMLAGKETGLLTEKQYKSSQFVQEINVFKANESTIKADKEKLEEDPAYLSEILRQRLQNSTNL